MPLPRGITNSNSGNIRKSLIPWQGQIVPGRDPNFCQFIDPQHGLRAIMVLLRRYYYVLGLTSANQIVTRWAPPGDGNNTPAYIQAVALQMRVDPAGTLTMCPETYISFAKAITVHENGTPPIVYPSCWYSDDVYDAAYKLFAPNAQTS